MASVDSAKSIAEFINDLHICIYTINILHPTRHTFNRQLLNLRNSAARERNLLSRERSSRRHCATRVRLRNLIFLLRRDRKAAYNGAGPARRCRRRHLKSPSRSVTSVTNIKR